MKSILPIPATSFLILAGALLFHSCTDPIKDSVKENKENEEHTTEFSETTTMRGLDYESQGEVIKMPSNAVYVQDDINSGLLNYDSGKNVIVFKDTDALEEAGIKEGDILYSAPKENVPEGFILKVNKVVKSEGTVEYICEEACLEDAFTELHTPLIFDSERLTEKNFTIFDPLGQNDLDETSSEAEDTKSLTPDLSYLDVVTDPDRYSIKFDSGKATIKYAVLDLDDDYKNTKNDQVVIKLTLDYTLGLDDSAFDFSKDPFYFNVEGKPRLGVSVGLEYTNTALDKKSKAKKKNLENIMKEKLLGKKFIIGEYDIPISWAVKVAIKPRFQIYAFFKIGVDGSIKIESGFEGIGFDFKVTNKDGDKSYLRSGNESEPFLRFVTEAGVAGKAGVGIGLTIGLPKISDRFFDSMVRPYAGLFYDFNGVLECKCSVETSDEGAKGHLTGSAYFESSGYAEGYARYLDGTLWNPKITIDAGSRTWPDPPIAVDTTYDLNVDRPVPYLVTPADESINEDPVIDLEWTFAGHSDDYETLKHYEGLKYDVYLSDDKTIVSQNSPTCRIATGITEKSCRFEPNRSGEYWWMVVASNSLGEEYESRLCSFDTASAGLLEFGPEITRYLKNHREMLSGVYIDANGRIPLTVSNSLALMNVKDVTVSDPDGEYFISSIDELLYKLPALESLDCSSNSITSLDLSANSGLIHLKCGSNRINWISFPSNARLKSIVADNNELSELDLSQFPELLTLNCSGNPLKALKPYLSKNLKILNCDGCRTETLTLGNPSLRELYVSDNSLSVLDIRSCDELLRLDFHAQSVNSVNLILKYGQLDNLTFYRAHVNVEYTYVGLPKNAVDLGLSVMWRSTNLGAEKPEDSGSFYAWAETSAKSDYSWGTYTWCGGDSGSISKYYINDNLSVMTSYDDAATQALKGNWRTPSKKEFEELVGNCDWEYDSANSCYKVVSRKNGNSICLPAAGYMKGSGLVLPGNVGRYWTLDGGGIINPHLAMHFDMGKMTVTTSDRYLGYCIRPVFGGRPNGDISGGGSGYDDHSDEGDVTGSGSGYSSGDGNINGSGSGYTE